jgi:hypothetical protein
MLKLISLWLLLSATAASAEGVVLDEFRDSPETRWSFFTDQVMGGISDGQVSFPTEQGRPVLHLTGDVRTANNGGFIQARAAISPQDSSLTGVRLEVRGNGARYFVHLRTTGTMLPWQYYQSGFAAGPEWTEVQLPFASFERSGQLLRRAPAPDSLQSIGIVAYGQDYQADLEVRSIGFY